MIYTDRVSLGFDLRVNPSCVHLSRSNGEQLLEPYRTSPVSADPAVWPTIRVAADLWGGLLPRFLNPLYLASDLGELIKAYQQEGIFVGDLYPVCITCEASIIASLNVRFGEGYFRSPITEGVLLSNNWELQGFDVVDLDGMISGLKGCGYRDPSWSQMRVDFGSSLNEKGLFFDSEQAKMFAKVREVEIAAHAPFVVVGVLTRKQTDAE